jgi:vitamin B12 transporter
VVHTLQFNGKQEGCVARSTTPNLRCPRNGQADEPLGSASVTQATERLEQAFGKATEVVSASPDTGQQVDLSKDRLFNPSTVGEGGEGVLRWVFLMKNSFANRAWAFSPAWSLVAMACSSAWAQISPNPINPVVVIGSRLEQPLQDVLPSVSVIQRADIEKAHVGDLSELLMGQPGIEFSRTGGAGSPISVYMRGGSSAQTMVLVDGIPFNSESATGGLSSLEAIPVSQIERVEILRGNASALYGPGAMGGVIQIFTRRGDSEKFSPYASLTYGRYNTVDTLVGFGLGDGATRYNLSVGRKESTGFEAISHAKYPALTINPSNNGHKGDSFSLSAEHDVSASHQIGFKALESETLTSFDNPYANTTAERWSNSSRTQLLQIYSKNRINTDWRSNISLSESTMSQRTLVDGVSEMHYGTSKSSQNIFRWDNTYVLNASHIGSFGYEFKTSGLDSQRDDWVTNQRLPLVSTAQKKRGYVGLNSNYGRLSIQTNASYEVLPNGVDGTTFLLGTGYQFNPSYKVTMTRSTAIQAPTVGQLNDVTQGGNSALGNEKSTSTELGLQFANGKTTARAVAFVVDYDRLIASGTTYVDDPYWGQGGRNIKKLVNVRNAHNTGIELAASHAYQSWRFGSSFTHQTMVYENVSTPVLNKSRNIGAVDVSYLWDGKTTVGWRTFASSARQTYDPSDNIVPTAGFGLTKVYVRTSLNDEWTTGVALENLFDRKYFQVAGFNNAGRSLFVNLTYRAK